MLDWLGCMYTATGQNHALTTLTGTDPTTGFAIYDLQILAKTTGTAKSEKTTTAGVVV